MRYLVPAAGTRRHKANVGQLKYMKNIIPFFVLVLAGCTSVTVPQFAMNEVVVPRQYRYLASIDIASEYEIYLGAYRPGYWDCLNDCRTNLDFAITNLYHPTGYGNPVAIEGYNTGYADAQKDVRKNIRGFGKDKTLSAIRAIWKGN